MKKFISLIVGILFLVFLAGCGTQTNAVATFEFEDESIDLKSVQFTVVIDDPETEITGTITVKLYNQSDEEVRSKIIASDLDLENIQFLNLTENHTYTIKVHASMGRNTEVIGTTTFKTLSTGVTTIMSEQDFLNMKSNRAGTYILGKDLDFSDIDFVSPFTTSFTGSFDGDGYTIRNVTFSKVATYTGLFGYVSTGTIKNLNIENVEIGRAEAPLTMSLSSRVGIVAGYVSNLAGKIEDVTIKNSSIHFTTSSTVQAFVGGIVGENRGQIKNVSLENTYINLKSTSYGDIKLGGVAGVLGEDSTLKEIKSEVDVTYELEGGTIKDRDFSIFIGGLVGDNNAHMVTRSVENVYSMGDVTVTNLDFNTQTGTTEGLYKVYVGGLAGMSYGVIYNAFYGGSMMINHEKNEFETNVNKYFYIGGLIGFYGSSRTSMHVLKQGESQTVEANLSDDVILKISQVIAQKLTGTFNASIYGDTHLVLNGDSIVDDDTFTLIDDLEDFFTSTWIEDAYEAVYTS
ncbi:MAG: hypothetical protein IH571_06480 [Acholeplasmataceae bacterium]|nr:hypothetical protein [Acholeplasmataceae bacterium]